MTLVELLLVLVLLVVAGGLAAPVVTDSFSSVRLRRAGDRILMTWAQAREKAVTTGDIQQFRFIPNAAQFRVDAWTGIEGEDPAVARSVATAADSPTADDNRPFSKTSLADAASIERSLPTPIVFHAAESATVDPLTRQSRVESLNSGKSTWSAPILFFADGSASQATVVLTNERQQFIRITLRGLTGVARASAIVGQDELQRTARSR